MKKGSPIDSHKLRVFCHNHGGAITVAKAIGRNTQTIYNAIHLGRATDKLIEELEAAYCLEDGFFSVTATTEQDAPAVEEKTADTFDIEDEAVTKPTNQPQTKSIVDELLDEMQKTAAGTQPKPGPDIPKIAVGKNLPKNCGWREKTLAEMTGEDIQRMAQSVVSGIMSTAVEELLGMKMEIKLAKDGGKYGW